MVTLKTHFTVLLHPRSANIILMRLYQKRKRGKWWWMKCIISHTEPQTIIQNRGEWVYLSCEPTNNTVKLRFSNCHIPVCFIRHKYILVTIVSSCMREHVFQLNQVFNLKLNTWWNNKFAKTISVKPLSIVSEQTVKRNMRENDSCGKEFNVS
jgi:hypothetical protein